MHQLNGEICFITRKKVDVKKLPQPEVVKYFLPFISLIACTKSLGSLKLTKPYPFVLLVLLSRTTLDFTKEGYLLKARAKTSSVTSLPKSPQNIRKSSVEEKNLMK